MSPKPLSSVVLLTKDNLGSMVTFNTLVRSPHVKIKAVYLADIPYKSIKHSLSFLKEHTNFSLYFFFERLYFKFILALPFFKNRYETIESLCRKHNIPVIPCDNINKGRPYYLLQQIQPDLILCSIFPQILKKRVLEIPKVASLNIHPGLLPEYQGVISSFWALRHNHPYTGVTVHEMTTKIDQGPIIAQKKVYIRPGDTQNSLTIRLSIVGARLMNRTLRGLAFGQPVGSTCVKDRPAKYYSIPKPTDFRAYIARRRFFRFRSFFFSLKRM